MSDRALVALAPVDSDWQPILQGSNQVVLYNPTSHALTIRHASHVPHRINRPCPYCDQPLPPDFVEPVPENALGLDDDTSSLESDPELHSRAANYFHLLAIANESTSRPPSPPRIPDGEGSRERRNGFPAEVMAEGYFKTFFKEEVRLGMGANGTVYLCQHVLDGNSLGHFAVKKIAVGESHSYLLTILREVRLLEQLRHPNIITYHHAWLESCQFSSFGPKVPTLHVLMQWAEGGSLDDFIDARLGRATSPRIDSHPTTTDAKTPKADLHSRSARIRAFRAQQRGAPEERARARDINATWTAVHLLSAEEVLSLYRDVVAGLAFLHDKSILHLDLKPGNVLLTWDEGRLIPRAMLSDFGTSRDMLHGSRIRSGNTGTLEYSAPETLPTPHTGMLKQIDSKADMWALGMILHKLLFFRLPYRYAAGGDANVDPTRPLSAYSEGDKMAHLEQEVLSYSGFESTAELVTAFETRHLSRAYLVLLEGLLNVHPATRPSCERVLAAIRDGKLNPLSDERRRANVTTLVPIQRHSNGATSVPASNPMFIEKQTQTHHAETTTPRGKEMSEWSDEQLPFLGLPSPPLPLDPSPWAKAAAAVPNPSTLITRTVWIRTTKSLVLLIKAFDVAALCAKKEPPRPLLMVILTLAIADSWTEGLWESVGLGAAHMALTRALFQSSWR